MDSKADYWVTGDKDLLELDKISSCQICLLLNLIL